jgi:organic radical activating enzyme
MTKAFNGKRNETLTQLYSTWGDKLLQHTDVLYSIQKDRKFKPITVQLAPVEVCDSDCPFCSVAARPLKSKLPFEKIQKVISDFRELGAKSVEITGGGNPLLYRDGDKTVNDIIKFAHGLGMDVGIITNSNNFKYLQPEVFPLINWIRVSLIKLDEGLTHKDYDFCGFPTSKLGLSYVIYDGTGAPDDLSRTKKTYPGTSVETIKEIAKFFDVNSDIKFVRLIGNCLFRGHNYSTREKYTPIVEEIDKHGKFFIKDIGDDDVPFDAGCYVGALRPYIAPNPHGGDYRVYMCTSHVLMKRTYDLDYSICGIDDVKETWAKMNEKFAKDGYPYEVRGNQGCGWKAECKFCHYQFSNKLLHTVANDMPNKNFA